VQLYCGFSVASDDATVDRQILNHMFSSISQYFEEGQRWLLWIHLDAVSAICWTNICALQCTKCFVVPTVGGATRIANLRWKFSKT